MKIKPIPFNADMTKAIWEGQKTTTRRVVKPQPKMDVNGGPVFEFKGLSRDFCNVAVTGFTGRLKCIPPYHPGDVLYVQEAWRLLEMWETFVFKKRKAEVEFRDGEVVQFCFDDWERGEKWGKYLDKPKGHWQSPYFMPREAARLFLLVTDVRVERLRDITEDQAIKEGARSTFGFVTDPENEYAPPPHSAVEDFQRIWDSTVKPKDRDLYGWAANPWVWVIKFERISREEAMKA